MAAAFFSSRRLNNIENEKIFLSLEIAEIDKGVQFWVGENYFGHENSFFKIKHVFGDKYFCDVISPKLEKLLNSKFCSMNDIVTFITHAKFHFNQTLSYRALCNPSL